MSRFWRVAYRVQYRILAWLDPLIRAVWGRSGIGNVVELRVRSRKHPTTSRARLVGILSANGSWYLGHPNGHVGWTRDLAAAGEGTLTWANGTTVEFRAEPLAPMSRERELAIRATNQHPFPGNLTYRLGRPHIRAVGVFFRVDPA